MLTTFSVHIQACQIPFLSIYLIFLTFSPLLHAFPCSLFFISFFLTIMAAISIKHIFKIILWLSLFLFFFPYRWSYFNFPMQNSTSSIISILDQYSLFSSDQNILSNIRELATKFHVIYAPPSSPLETPFIVIWKWVEQRYGVEKRYVPCGPNPLHHWG